MSRAAPKFRPSFAGTSDHDRWRGSAASRGYDHAWTQLRNRKIREQPLCEMCLLKTPAVTREADEVHHIVPVKKAPWLRLVIENLQSLCKSCHQIITRRDQGG